MRLPTCRRGRCDGSQESEEGTLEIGMLEGAMMYSVRKEGTIDEPTQNTRIATDQRRNLEVVP